MPVLHLFMQYILVGDYKIGSACLVSTCSYQHKQFPALANLPVCLQADNSSSTGMANPPHPQATNQEAAIGSADWHVPAKGAPAPHVSSDNHARGREMLRVKPPWQLPPTLGG